MIGALPRRRGIPGPARARASRLSFENLEDRILMYTTTGGKWTDPVQISYSIVPDGTSIGGTPSNLQQVLSTKPGWQLQIQKAVAAWEAVAGINLVQVPDDGSPIGIAGNQQDDPRFGDIRIGGMAQPGGQLGFAYAPPPFNGGTNAGDLFFNTSQSWQTNGQTYDLMTVAIHELGHALGMDHSAVTAADMYASYTQAKQTLSSDDTAGIQSIYGARKPDAFDAAASNNSSRDATEITSYLDDAGRIALANLDISSSSDVDWYKVTAPASTVGMMTVAMQSSNLSSLIPSVSVYNANLRLAGGSTGSSSGSTISVSISGINPGQVWYIKALAGTTGPAGVGAYGLMVNFGSSPQSPIASPAIAVAGQPDQNPTTLPMRTGWVLGGKFVPFTKDKQGNQDERDEGDGPGRITTGSLTGFGDRLEVGHLRGHRHEANGRLVKRGAHHSGDLPREWVAPGPGGRPASPVPPQANDIGTSSHRARTTALSRHHRVVSNWTESARNQTVDAALESRWIKGLLSMRPSLSRARDDNHPRGQRAIAHTIGDISP